MRAILVAKVVMTIIRLKIEYKYAGDMYAIFQKKLNCYFF